MKLTKILLILTFVITFSWLYYIYINPIFFSKKDVIVPNIVGYSIDDAQRMLQESKLSYTINYIDGLGNLVSHTKPKENTKVKEGYTVNVYVYNNCIANYNNFEGLVFDVNEDKIKEYCLNYSLNYEVIYEINNELPEGIIISQMPNDSKKIEVGETIKFVVSANNSYFCMPNLVGLNVNSAINILNNYNLNFNLIYINSLIDVDLVLQQEVKEGKVIKKGNSYPIDIYVSKGLPLDLDSIDSDSFIESLSYLDINYDIIYIDSLEKNKIIKIITYDNNSLLAYKIYISK